MKMAADVTPADLRPLPSEASRAQALASSLLVTIGAFLAAAVMLVAAAVSLPIMLVASATLEQSKRPPRRGWQELEAPRA